MAPDYCEGLCYCFGVNTKYGSLCAMHTAHGDNLSPCDVWVTGNRYLYIRVPYIYIYIYIIYL